MGEKSKELVWHIYGKMHYKLLLNDIYFSKRDFILIQLKLHIKY